MSSVDLVVGLGNPGPEYEDSYHNVGFQAVDTLSQHFQVSSHRNDRGDLYRLRDGPVDYLGKPGQYVNRSGPVVRHWCESYDLDPTRLLLIYDDFAIDAGRVRIRPSGSSGGHNGVESVIETLGTEEFPRVRIGIGPVPEGKNPVDFVLEPMRGRTRSVIMNVIEAMPELVRVIVTDGVSEAMNRWNGVDFRE